MSVRPALAADAGVLAQVAAATFALACPPQVTPEAIESFIRTVLSLARFQEYLADPARDLFVAEQDGAVVGYAMLVAGEPGDADVRVALSHRPTVELSKIYVLPQSHGGAVAAELMAVAVDAARRRGAAGVWLGVNQLNERAQRFYAKSGFARVGTKRFLVGDRYEDDFVYERAVGSP